MKLKKKKKITPKELKRDPFQDFLIGLFDKASKRLPETIGITLLVIGAIVLIFVLRGGGTDETAFPVARQMWFQAVSLIQSQRLQEAQSVLQELSVRFPNSVEGKKAIYYLANLAFFQGDYIQAKTRFESYLAKKPKDPLLKASAKAALGIIDFTIGNIEGGKKKLLEAMEEVPYESFKVFFGIRLVNLLILNERYREAKEVLKKIKEKYELYDFASYVNKFETMLEGALK